MEHTQVSAKAVFDLPSWVSPPATAPISGETISPTWREANRGGFFTDIPRGHYDPDGWVLLAHQFAELRVAHTGHTGMALECTGATTALASLVVYTIPALPTEH
jgi:hypothetical protein